MIPEGNPLLLSRADCRFETDSVRVPRGSYQEGYLQVYRLSATQASPSRARIAEEEAGNSGGWTRADQREEEREREREREGEREGGREGEREGGRERPRGSLCHTPHSGTPRAASTDLTCCKASTTLSGRRNPQITRPLESRPLRVDQLLMQRRPEGAAALKKG